MAWSPAGRCVSMGNTGQGYDVCSVFNLCLLAPSFPSASLCSQHPFYSPPTPICSFFLPFSFPHCHSDADFLLSCSACVVVKCIQKRPLSSLDRVLLAGRGRSMERPLSPSTALQICRVAILSYKSLNFIKNPKWIFLLPLNSCTFQWPHC